MLQVNQLIGFGAGGSSASISFVGSAVAGKVGATSGNSTIPLNTGLTGGLATGAANGDLVIAAFATGSSSDRTLAITDGTNPYTLIATELYQNTEVFEPNLRVAYKFITGDTATTFGPTGNADDGGAMAVFVFRGVDPVTPLDVAAVTFTADESVAPNPPAITPVTSNAVVVCVGSNSYTGTSNTFTSSDLLGFRTEAGVDDNSANLGMGYGLWTGGAFDAAAFTPSTTLDALVCGSLAMSIALRPAA